MFANLNQLIGGRPPSPEVERSAFVEHVQVERAAAERREPRVEWLIAICWLLIAAKHVFIIWACRTYPVPFHQLWINFPTWMLGALATGIYFARTRPRPPAPKM
jgi:hypothetical protein